MKKSITLLFAVAASSSFAQVIYSTGFEAPTYAGSSGAGTSINAQDGWAATTSAFAASTTPFTVSTNQANGGTQSAYINTSPLATSQYAVRSVGAINSGVLSISSDLFIGPRVNTADPDGSSGYSLVVSTTVLGAETRLAQFLIYRPDSTFPEEVDLGTRSGGAFGFLTQSAPVFVYPQSQWNRVRLDLDFGNNTASAYINNNLILTRAFDPGLSTTRVGIGGTSDGFDVGYFDNFQAAITPVPEPATLAVLGLGAAAMIRRRRSK
jgi:hypothetical protein